MNHNWKHHDKYIYTGAECCLNCGMIRYYFNSNEHKYFYYTNEENLIKTNANEVPSCVEYLMTSVLI